MGKMMKTRLIIIAFALSVVQSEKSYSQTFSDINGIRFVSAFSGADLGAKINSAVADCQVGGTTCNLYVDIPGTISTMPDVPAGYTITFAPGTYTLTTTIKINHTHTTWNFGNAFINYPLDTGGQVVWIGKNIYGTATAVGNILTSVTGPGFADVDAGDGVYFNGAAYNVASSTATTLTLTQSAGTVNVPANFGMFLSGDGDVGATGPIIVRDLNIHHSTPINSTTIDAIHVEAVTGLRMDGIYVTGFSGGTSNALNCIACISNKFQNFTANANAHALNLDGRTMDGTPNSEVDSNENNFYGYDFVANTGGSDGEIHLQGKAGSNHFFGGRYEGNRGGYAVHIMFTANCSGNVWYAPYFESNGNGTPGSADFLQQCGQNSIYDASNTTGSVNFPVFAYVAQSVGTLMNVTNISVRGLYTTSLSYMSGAGGKIMRANTSGIPYAPGNAQFEDINGNIISNGINATGYQVNGSPGFSGTKTVGPCTLTVNSGLITNVTGC